MQNIDEFNQTFQVSNTKEILQLSMAKYKGGVLFSSSLGAEDQVLTDLILKIDKSVQIVTLDTGRLPYETYKTIEDTEKKYQIKIQVQFPNYISVENMVRSKGINLFYESIENRKECCLVRKLEPLARAMKEKSLWITGLRREQSVTRSDMKFAEWDEKYSVLKINPLLNWTEKQVWEYIKENNVPYNELHDKGYPSIGCAPCTRAIEEGEDSRAGRWWWEDPATKECGLHWKDGKLVPNKTKNDKSMFV
ncbi:MAG: phosphoadenylyl-sulfate reductase [Leptospiraceae bacterium]|nr:phosphoadenylyl-sulfate reductase [Leptospiraceae bacterium]